MEHKIPQTFARSSLDTATVWYVSFGDLLTLLLCFFLVLTPRFGVHDENSSSKERVTDSHTASLSTGTRLATQALAGTGVFARSIPITVSTSDLHDVSAVQAQVLAGWNAFRGLVGADAYDVTVRLCSKDQREELLALVYRERLALGRQLRRLRIEAFSLCDATRWGVSPKREVVAVLDFSKV